MVARGLPTAQRLWWLRLSLYSSGEPNAFLPLCFWAQVKRRSIALRFVNSFAQIYLQFQAFSTLQGTSHSDQRQGPERCQPFSTSLKFYWLFMKRNGETKNASLFSCFIFLSWSFLIIYIYIYICFFGLCDSMLRGLKENNSIPQGFQIIHICICLYAMHMLPPTDKNEQNMTIKKAFKMCIQKKSLRHT